MSHVAYAPVPLPAIDPAATSPVEWVWHGLLARGDITLLTSAWKSGKTTLVAGLLDALDAGRPFLGHDTVAADSVIVSEEAPVHWAERRAVIPGGRRARLVSRPFPGMPSPADWDALVAAAEAGRAEAPLDLFVVDTLAAFLPGASESHVGTVLAFLRPLRRLAAAGTAVLVLHHPRRKATEAGSTARGSGALLGYVDVITELGGCGRLASDANRRRLTVRSRHPSAPETVVYEWAVGTPEFRVVEDGCDARFRENWDEVRRLLADRAAGATAADLLTSWPEDRPGPSQQQMYGWLHRAVRDGLAARRGRGTKGDPYRFSLPTARTVLADLPELPPL